MKAFIRKYVPLAVMLLLLGLIISFMPAEASHGPSYGHNAPSQSAQKVVYTQNQSR
jgi:hypothetical protein